MPDVYQLGTDLKLHVKREGAELEFSREDYIGRVKLNSLKLLEILNNESITTQLLESVKLRKVNIESELEKINTLIDKL